jgi:hypothetical protein
MSLADAGKVEVFFRLPRRLAQSAHAASPLARGRSSNQHGMSCPDDKFFHQTSRLNPQWQEAKGRWAQNRFADLVAGRNGVQGERRSPARRTGADLARFATLARSNRQAQYRRQPKRPRGLRHSQSREIVIMALSPRILGIAAARPSFSRRRRPSPNRCSGRQRRDLGAPAPLSGNRGRRG